MTTLTLPEAFARVRGYLDEQQHLQAIGLCEHILEQHPTNLEALRLLGEAYLAERRYEQAAAAFDQVVHADPDSIPARVGLGIAYERQGLIDAAVTEFEQALEVRPDMPELRAQLIRMYSEHWGSEGATLRLSRTGLARLYAKGRMLQQAVQEYRNYVAEHPQRFDAWVGLLEALWRDRQYDSAVETARKILDKRPEVLKANLILGHILMSRGDERGRNYWLVAQRADPFYEVAQQLFPTLPKEIPALDTSVRAWDEQAALTRLSAAATQPVLDEWFPAAEDEPWSLDLLDGDSDPDTVGPGRAGTPAALESPRRRDTASDLSLLSSLLTDADFDDDGPLLPAAAGAAVGETGRLSGPQPGAAAAAQDRVEVLNQLEATLPAPAAPIGSTPAPTDPSAVDSDDAFADIEQRWADIAGGSRELERLAAELRVVEPDAAGLMLHPPPSADDGTAAAAHPPLEPYQIEYVHTTDLPPLVSPTAALLPPLDYHELPPLEVADVPPIAAPQAAAPAAAEATPAATKATPAAAEAAPAAAEAAPAATEAAPAAAEAAPAATEAAPASAETPPAATEASVAERILDVAEALTDGGSASTAARALDLAERVVDVVQQRAAATLQASATADTAAGVPDMFGLLPTEMDWLVGALDEPSALESAELNDPLLAELLDLQQQRGYLDLADIIAAVDRHQGNAARIDQLGWSLYSLGVEIRHGDEVVELTEDELPVGALSATVAEPLAALPPEPAAPAAVLAAAAPPAPAGPSPGSTLATVIVRNGATQPADYLPSGDSALDRMLERLSANPLDHTLALAMARFCAQTGRRELMNLLFRRPLRQPELLDQIGEEIEDLIGLIDDGATQRTLHRLLGDVRTRQGRAADAVTAYSMTFSADGQL